MATVSEPTPSKQHAQKALRQARKDEDAVIYPPLPLWFFVGQALLMGGLCLAQLLPPADSPKASFGLIVAAIVMGVTHWLNRDGVSWVNVRFGDMIFFVAALAGIFVVCLAIDELSDAWWIWIPGAVAASAIILRTGQVYRRTFGA